MPRGDKSKYTDKQQRMAEHIEESVRERGGSEEQAERIGWATVNKTTGGGLKKKRQISSATRKKLSAAGKKGAKSRWGNKTTKKAA
jgi:hypothetical protein